MLQTYAKLEIIGGLASLRSVANNNNQFLYMWQSYMYNLTFMPPWKRWNARKMKLEVNHRLILVISNRFTTLIYGLFQTIPYQQIQEKVELIKFYMFIKTQRWWRNTQIVGKPALVWNKFRSNVAALHNKSMTGPENVHLFIKARNPNLTRSKAFQPCDGSRTQRL